MRVMLVTTVAELKNVFFALNHTLEYRAIVVDEPETAKAMIKGIGLSENIVYPIHDLQECLENFYFEYVVCATRDDSYTILPQHVESLGFPKNRLINLLNLNTPYNFLMARALKYFIKNSTRFKIFSTGMSYCEDGLHPKSFKHGLFNFGRASQDLYYDYQIAKFIVDASKKRRGGGVIKYALIGLAPYSFHYDQSKADGWLTFNLLQYLIAFNDLHNFWMPVKQYKTLFRDEYLSFRLPEEQSEINSVSLHEFRPNVHMDLKNRLSINERVKVWKDKGYPDTRKENVKILDEYLTLCEKNSIRPIMFLPPMAEGYTKYFSSQKLEEFHFIINEMGKKHSTATFFDGWKLKDFTEADFLDADHLNINGAVKFSIIFNQVIEKLDRQ